MQDAINVWQCGNEDEDEDCLGTELDESGDRMTCPACGREYLSDGTVVTDED